MGGLPPIFGPALGRFQKGDILRVSVRAWTTAVHTLFYRVTFDDGSGFDDTLIITHSAGDFANETFKPPKPFEKDGYFEAISFESGSGVERGEIYAMAQIAKGSFHWPLCSAWVGNHQHGGLGIFEPLEIDEYWGGRTWTYAADVTNDVTNSGTHEYDTVPGAGNEMEVLYGLLKNDDTSARTGFARIRDTTEAFELGRVTPSFSITAGQHLPFPVVDEAGSAGASRGRWIITGTMQLNVELLSVAVSQDSAFHLVARIRGGLPTVTITSPTGATETVSLNAVQ